MRRNKMGTCSPSCTVASGSQRLQNGGAEPGATSSQKEEIGRLEEFGMIVCPGEFAPGFSWLGGVHG